MGVLRYKTSLGWSSRARKEARARFRKEEKILRMALTSSRAALLARETIED
jgi:hypothetical protein